MTVHVVIHKLDAEEISLGMFPSEHFHEIQEEVAVLLTVSLFIIVVIASGLHMLQDKHCQEAKQMSN